MFVPPAIVTMLWHGMPPEINTSRLMAGAGPAPMLQAAAGWEAFAILLETQADELAGSLASLSAAWSGQAGERAVQATMPMVMWLRMASLQCHKRALQATAQATSYTAAMAATPQLVEIELNHITHAILEATNFFFVNTIPIGLNEADYVRMWNQAAAVMDTYQFETTTNAIFEPIPMVKPITVPGLSAANAAVVATTLLKSGDAAIRNATMARVTAEGVFQVGALQGGRVAATAGLAANHSQTQARRTESVAQQANQESQPLQQSQPAQQGVQMATQLATQVGSTVAQLPQQLTQMVTQPMQQLTQPLQQMTSLFSSTGADRAQIGLIGTNPLSNHPLVGGTGPSSGAGMVRAASLPGAGGTMASTPLMSNLVKVDAPVVTAGAGAGSPGTGLAPVGAGSNGAPVGTAGRNGKSGGTRHGLATPSLLAYDTREEEDDDW